MPVMEMEIIDGDGTASRGHPATSNNNWNSICWNYSVPGPKIGIGNQTENWVGTDRNVNQPRRNPLMI